MAITKQEFDILIEILSKAVEGEAATAGKAAGSKEGEGKKTDPAAAAERYKITKMTTEELLKQAAAQAEINSIDFEHNKTIHNKAAARKNVIEMIKQRADIEERLESSLNELNEKELTALKETKEALDEKIKRGEAYVGHVNEMTEAQERALGVGQRMGAGIAGALGMTTNASQGFFGSMLKGIGEVSGEGGIGYMIEGLRETLGFTNFINSGIQTIVTSSLQMATAIESANASLARVTGQGRRFAADVETIALANTNLGLSADGVGKAYGELVVNTANFNNMSRSVQMEIAETTAQLERLGVTTSDSAKIFDLFNNAFGVTGTEAANVARDMAAMGIALGVGAEKMNKDFIGSLPVLAAYGKRSGEVFKGIAAAAKAAGVETSVLIGIAEKFETFSSAAESAAKLNAVLGTSISPTQMLTMSHEQVVETLIMQVQSTGMAFNELDRFTKKAIAAQAGITDMSEASKIFSMSISKYRGHVETMDNARMAQEEMNKKLTATMTLADKLKGAFMSLAISLGPYIEMLSDGVNMLAAFIQEHKVLAQAFFIVTGLAMLAWKAFTMFGTAAAILGGNAAGAGAGITSFGASVSSAIAIVGAAIQGFIASLTALLAGTGGAAGVAVGIIILLVVAMTALAYTVSTVVGHLVDLAKAMLASKDAILPMVAGFGAFLGMMVLMGTPLGSLAVLGMFALAAGLTAIGIALQFMPLEVLREIATIMSSLAMIEFDNLTKSFAAVKAGISEIKKEFGDLSEGSSTVAVTSLIENLALISTGRATSTATGKAISATAGLGDISVENIMKPEFQFKLEIDGEPIDAIATLVHYREGGSA